MTVLKRIAVLIVCTLITGCLTGAAGAQVRIADGLSFDAYMRYRTEWDDRGFAAGSDMDSYSTLRTRLGLRMDDIIENTEMYVLIGDSRKLGFSNPYLTGVPAGPNDFDNNLGVVQAYVSVREFLFPELTVTLGRMPYNHGRSRFFGPGDWNFNGPRRYDGLMASWDAGHYIAEVFNFWGLEGDRHWRDNASNKDHLLTGVNVRLMEKDLQLLALLDHDGEQVADLVSGGTNARHNRVTLLGYYTWAKQPWTVTADLAYQTGRQASAAGNADISAYLFAADIQYAFSAAMKPTAGIGIDIQSGDDGGDPEKVGYFTAQYYSKHRFLGTMDYFKSVESNQRGLQAYILRAGCAPRQHVKVNVDFITFRYEKGFISAVDGSTAHLAGNEIDVKTDCTVRNGIKFQVGADMFLPSEDWKGTGAETTFFGYMALTVSF